VLFIGQSLRDVAPYVIPEAQTTQAVIVQLVLMPWTSCADAVHWLLAPAGCEAVMATELLIVPPRLAPPPSSFLVPVQLAVIDLSTEVDADVAEMTS
jgi:hypothetical protein